MTSAEVLKRGPKRTVLLERPAGERAVVVKRFHDPGRVGRFVDRWRARREDRRNRALYAAELPVPEPLARRRRDGAWEFVSAFVEGATLDELLDGDAPWPVSRSRVARGLGRLVATLDLAGWVHRDAHAGNVLIDPDGKPWILDAGQVVRARRESPTRRLRLLTSLCAGVRERASLGFRAGFLDGFRAEGAGRFELPKSVESSIEDEARAFRFKHASQRALRWTRESGATFLRFDDRGGSIRVRVMPPGRLRRSAPLELDESGRRWWAHTRWVEHGLPGLRPVAEFFRPPRRDRCRVITAVPDGARPLLEQPDPAALGTLLGAVHDRGLFLPNLDWSELWIAANGALLLDAPAQTMLTAENRARQWESALPWDWSALPAEDRRAFLLAYARASRHSRAERKALEAEAEHA